jgi:hypothetical protein
MRILSEGFVSSFSGKILNIHPSLLPKYPGLHTHKKAIEQKDNYHGASVHLVTAELDGGPVVIQSQIKVNKDDTVGSLSQRVANTEWIIYPLVVKWFCSGDLCFVLGKQVDNHIGNQNGYYVSLRARVEDEIDMFNAQLSKRKGDKNKTDCRIIINKGQDKLNEKEHTHLQG